MEHIERSMQSLWRINRRPNGLSDYGESRYTGKIENYGHFFVGPRTARYIKKFRKTNSVRSGYEEKRVCLECPLQGLENLRWKVWNYSLDTWSRYLSDDGNAFVIPSKEYNIFGAELQFNFTREKRKKIKEKIREEFLRRKDLEKAANDTHFGFYHLKFFPNVSYEYLYFTLCPAHSKKAKETLNKIVKSSFGGKAGNRYFLKFNYLSDWFAPEEVEAKITRSLLFSEMEGRDIKSDFEREDD